ncbi:MAG TPA: ribonuclease J [Clostridia bacterium]|nr:ribonuclease J [Clostridia bacterium]HOM34580.1 ribonuclease J [Clostridia bacterium]HOT70217.1 ribonuclease J [Clostridia bacterium]HPL08280.1 ribonuclease J [Clostridia bacterium]HQJ92683.1 ribonuclease J [Clostridia bacterium]
MPLGGLNEIGKNLTVFEYRNDILILDCGIKFPQEDMPGVDIVKPDMSYLVENKDKIKGVVITHAHEDHIGAVCYLLKEINTPVYGAKLTLGLLESKLNEMNLLTTTSLNIIDGDSIISIGCFKLEFIPVNHSIPDTYAVVINTPVGIILHTSDFKIDYNPVNEKVTDLNRFSELGNRHVLLMMADSTNATKEGHSMSERAVGDSLDNLFRKASSRIIVASFASNIHRIQQILNLAEKYKKKVCIFGFSMRNNIRKSIELGYIQVKRGIIIEDFEIKNYKHKDMVFIVTGSQGETNSALSKIAFKEHQKISVEKNDLVIISASVIPGNEKYLYRVINELFKSGANVIYQALNEVHASGHAYRQELRLLLTLVRPKYYMPVHGEFMHMESNALLAMEMGIKEKNIFLLENGDVMKVYPNRISVDDKDKIKVGLSFVDGHGVGELGDDVLKEREILAGGGILNISIVLNKSDRKSAVEPVIIPVGFVYESESDDIIRKIREMLDEDIGKYTKTSMSINELQNSVKKRLRKFLYQETKRNPVVLPVIMEV